MRSRLQGCWMKEFAQLLLAFAAQGLAKADVLVDERSGGIEHERAWHSHHFVARSELPFRVVDHVEVRRHLGQKALGIGTLTIHVHADHDQAIAVFRLHLIQPRKGVAARFAPRCPKIDEDDPAAVLREPERLSGARLSGARLSGVRLSGARLSGASRCGG